MDFTGKIVEITKDYKTGNPRITLETTENILFEAEQLSDMQLSCRLVRFRKRRSLDANAYFWVLANKLSDTTGIPVTEIYTNYIRNIGGNNTITCVQNKAVDTLVSCWKRNGIGWIADTCESKIPGCTNVILYYGSSTYDTKQMSRLIDMVVEDCKDNGIETMTPAELDMLKAGWGE